MYQLEIPVRGAKLTIAGDSVEVLVEEYEHLNGSAKLLLSNIEDSVADYEAGKLDFKVQLEAAVGAVSEEQAADAEIDQRSRRPRSAPKAESDDPWGVDPDEDERPAARRTEPSRGKSRPAPRRTEQAEGYDEDRDNGVYKAKDRWGNEWTMNLPDAPDCDGHGEPAARFKGKSRAGKPYTVWKCAKGAPEGDWRDKCDFSEFPD